MNPPINDERNYNFKWPIKILLNCRHTYEIIQLISFYDNFTCAEQKLLSQ